MIYNTNTTTYKQLKTNKSHIICMGLYIALQNGAADIRRI